MFKKIEYAIIQYIENKTERNLIILYMEKQIEKIVFIGDIDSINIELIYKAHKILKNKV